MCFSNKILGNTKTFSLEKIIFHFSVLSSIIINSLILIEAILYNFSPIIKFLISLDILVFLMLYLVSKSNPNRYWPVWTFLAINLAIIIFDWFFVGGITGISRPLAISIAGLLPFITLKKHLKTAIIGYFTFFLLLFVQTSFSLDILPEVKMKNQVIFESLIETGALSTFMIFISSLTVKSYRQEKLKVLELNQSLDKYINEINLRNEVLSRLDESRNKFLSIIAHDLRGPVGTIYSMNDKLLSEYSEFTEEERKKFLLSLTETSKNTFNLLENLLEWSKVEGGRMPINKKEIDLQNTINEVISLNAPAYKKKNVKLKTKLVQTTAYTDKNVIQTIIRNLLSNALKFTPPNKEVSVITINDDEQVTIEVSDQGIGMNDEIIRNLFKPDKMKSRNGTRDEKGSGLGLILSHQLAQKVGARISITSELNTGSSFKLIIPKYNSKDLAHQPECKNTIIFQETSQ